MSIKYSRQARIDLIEQVDYIIEKNPAAAQQLFDQIVRTLNELDAGAFDGPQFELKTGEKVRGWPVRPLRIYYQRRGQVVFVVRIYHQARKPITR